MSCHVLFWIMDCKLNVGGKNPEDTIINILKQCKRETSYPTDAQMIEKITVKKRPTRQRAKWTINPMYQELVFAPTQWNGQLAYQVFMPL